MKKYIFTKYVTKLVIIVILLVIMLGPNVYCTEIYTAEEDEGGNIEMKFSCEQTAIRCVEDMGCGKRTSDQPEQQETDKTQDVSRPGAHTETAPPQPIQDWDPGNDPTNKPSLGDDAHGGGGAIH